MSIPNINYNPLPLNYAPRETYIPPREAYIVCNNLIIFGFCFILLFILLIIILYTFVYFYNDKYNCKYPVTTRQENYNPTPYFYKENNVDFLEYTKLLKEKQDLLDEIKELNLKNKLTSPSNNNINDCIFIQNKSLFQKYCYMWDKEPLNPKVNTKPSWKPIGVLVNCNDPNINFLLLQNTDKPSAYFIYNEMIDTHIAILQPDADTTLFNKSRVMINSTGIKQDLLSHGYFMVNLY